MLEVFPVSPASAKPLWVVVPVCLVLAFVLALMLYTAHSSRHSRVELSGEQLRLVGDLWGREIPLRSLDVARARVLDLGAAPQYRPARRTFGTGLPGYASGWFRLRNGEKALVYLTRQDAVAYVPTTDGYALLLSVETPERFVAALAARAPR